MTQDSDCWSSIVDGLFYANFVNTSASPESIIQPLVTRSTENSFSCIDAHFVGSLVLQPAIIEGHIEYLHPLNEQPSKVLTLSHKV